MNSLNSRCERAIRPHTALQLRCRWITTMGRHLSHSKLAQRVCLRCFLVRLSTEVEVRLLWETYAPQQCCVISQPITVSLNCVLHLGPCWQKPIAVRMPMLLFTCTSQHWSRGLLPPVCETNTQKCSGDAYCSLLCTLHIRSFPGPSTPNWWRPRPLRPRS